MKITLPIGEDVQLYDDGGNFIDTISSVRVCEYHIADLDAWRKLYDTAYNDLDDDSFNARIQSDRDWAYCYEIRGEVKYNDRLVGFLVFDKWSTT